MEEFGQKLREVRIAKGYTQQTLAEKLYVTRQTVSRWESGNRYPDLETLKKISVELEVSVDELLSIEPHPDEQKEMTAEEEKTTDVFEKSKRKEYYKQSDGSLIYDHHCGPDNLSAGKS